jgi:cytoskeleton protein RodZ
MAPEPAAPAATTPGQTAASTPSTAGTTNQGTPGQPATTGAGAQPSTGQSAAQAGGDATPDVAAAATSSTTRISVRAKLESWVQINDKDGKPILSRVLRAGEIFAVPDEKGLVMNTGNAGGIEMVVDGKTLPSLGSIGLVKRNIILDPDKLASGSVQTKSPTKAEPADGTVTAPTGD